MRQAIRAEVLTIEPMDALEADTRRAVLDWIDSGAPLCRTVKPATPAKHLVSYFLVVDGDSLLLVDHINAQKWLPTGGHVEPNEHPRETVRREALEELALDAEFACEQPVFITSTETVGLTAGHTDVSLWYVLNGDAQRPITFDAAEFHDCRWFHRDALPADTDPHLARFVHKLAAGLPGP